VLLEVLEAVEEELQEESHLYLAWDWVPGEEALDWLVVLVVRP
jgi:hypothetical protein